MARLAGKPADPGIIQVVRQGQPFVAAKRLDIGVLPVQIAGIEPVDFDLFGNRRRNRPQLGPDRCQNAQINARMAEQFVDVLRLRLLHQAEDLLGLLEGKVRDPVRRLVRRHPLDDLGHVPKLDSSILTRRGQGLAIGRKH